MGFIKSLDFDGVNDRVRIADHATLDITDHLSVSIWADFAAVGAGDAVVAKYLTAGNHRSWRIGASPLGAQKLYLFFSGDGIYAGGNSREWSSTANILTGWHHIVVTFDGGDIKAYIDGTEITSWTKTQDDAMVAIHSGAADLTIGAIDGGGQEFPGEICNVSVWDTVVLSADDVEALYNEGLSMDPDDLSTSAQLVSSWLWNCSLDLVPAANDVPDNTGANDGTTVNMLANDVVDSPYLCPEGKTAPTDYPVIPSSRFLPMEPVMQGNPSPAPAPLGLEDLAEGVNHLASYHLPQVINQPMQMYLYGAGGTVYLTTADQAAAGAMRLRLVYMIPPVSNHLATTTTYLRYKFLVAGDAGTDGIVRIATSLTNTDASVIGTGAWAWVTGTVRYDDTITETIQISTQRTVGAGEIAVKHVSVFIEPGTDPAIYGLDCHGWQADSPLSVHLRRAAAARLEWLMQYRRSIIMTWSADMENTNRLITVTNSTLTPFARAPVKYGPLMDRIRYYINGHQNGVVYDCEIWNNNLGYAGATSVALPLVGAWTATGSWVNGTLSVIEDKRRQAEELYVKLTAGAGVTTTLTGICAWEEQG
jgi:hypothetical protein